MTIASKTRLLNFQYIRAGQPFAEVSTRANFDATEAQEFGAPFYGVGNEESITYPNILAQTRFGAPFSDVTAKSSINASEFDYSLLGAPFWARYSAPSTFDTSRFFLMF